MERSSGLLMAVALGLALAACGKDTGNSGPSGNCGNGRIDSGEACDGANLNSQTCLTRGFLSGTISCNADCTLNTTACVAKPNCGDGQLQAGEDCDGAALNGKTCAALGFDSGTLACAASCTFDVSGCSGCGNSKVDDGEECDGTDLAGETCATRGFTAGQLACDATCKIDTNGCTKCGNNDAEGAEACDGTDLKGETCQTKGFLSGALACATDCASFNTTNCLNNNCGNNVAETGEICDGTDLRSQTCAMQGFTSGSLACAADCHSFNTSGCTTSSTCGNNTGEGTEECDGTDLRGQTCQTQGFTGGTLACGTNCKFKTTSCTGATCGVPSSLASPVPVASSGVSMPGIAVLSSFDLNTDPDSIIIQLYSDYGVMTSGIATGSFTLSGAELSYETCGLCVVVVDNLKKTYMPSGGTVTLTSVSGRLTGTLTNVNFREVTIDNYGVTTPVAGGCTTSTTSMAFDTALSVWTCDPNSYNDPYDICDCGCGTADPDCIDASKASCDYCDDSGSCGNASCSNCSSASCNINATNNAVCGP